MKKLTLFFFVALLNCAAHVQATEKQENTPIVIGWVPPYAIEKSMQALDSSPEIAKGISRIGLQFWNPSADGKGLVFAPIDQAGKLVSEEEVKRVVAWAKERKIEVLLTVYNNSQVIGKWDWELAKRAFAGNPKLFSKALLKEMHRFNLDGIDLDLEGEGQLNEDRRAYAKFVKHLSRQLRKQKKLLTIDSFHSPCANAPNMSWWADWKGQIDAIHSMGYQDLYEGSSATFTPEGKGVCENGASIFKYSWQKQYALNVGYQQHQIVLGMPTWLEKWGSGGMGSDIVSHIKELKSLELGAALWDLQLSGKGWRGDAVWKEMQTLQETIMQDKNKKTQ